MAALRSRHGHYIFVNTCIGTTTICSKAIVDSPALCTPVTPFSADPIFSEHGSDGMIVLHDVILAIE